MDNYRTDIFKTALLFGVILFVGIVLRLIIHLNGPLDFDEIVSWAIARRTPFLNMWVAGFSEPTPPIYETVVHFTMSLLGDTPALIRTPSALFGVLILPLTFWIMRLGTFDKKDSLCAMAIVAVSPMLIYYSQELRAYSMLAFTGVLSVGLLLRCLRKPTNINSLVFAITIFILAHIHRYGLLLIAAELFCVILYRQWKILAFFSVSMFLVLLIIIKQIISGEFYYSLAIDRVTRWDSLFALINFLNVGIDLGSITGYHNTPFIYYSRYKINFILSMSGLIVFTTIILRGLAYVRNYVHEQKQFMIILASCIIIPSALALISGTPLIRIHPQWLLRGLIYIWPLYYISAVAFCSTSRYKLYLILSIIMLNCFSLYPYYTSFNRCPQANALERLNRRTNENDIIVANPWYFYDGRAQQAAYDPTEGWIDIKRLRASDYPFVESRLSLTITTPPIASGNVYFFWWIDDLKCLSPFLNNKIFVYDDSNKYWKRYITKK